MSDLYDLLVAGSGQVGLIIAICAARAGLRFAVLELDDYGGGRVERI